MKVLLVASPPNDLVMRQYSIVLFEPLALEYVGAGIQDNHEVKLLDLRVDTESGLKETLESFQPDIIGIGAYTQEVNSAKRVLAEAKKLMPNILTVMGGLHATMIAQDLFEDYIDVVVVGEGVFPFKKICDHHEQGKGFQDIENIYIRSGSSGKMTFTHKAPFPELDSLPFPNRQLTSRIRHRFMLRLLLNRPVSMANFRGSVGCFHHCNFCSVTKMYDAKVYRRSFDKIIEEMETIEEPLLFWTDDEFFIEQKQSLELAKALQQSGIKKYHYVFGRSDTIIRNPALIEAWAKAGLILVYLGLEAHREQDLQRMGKTTSLSKNEESIRVLHQNGVKVHGGFIIQPDFEKRDFRTIAKYVRNLDIDYSTFTILTPLPGTDLWEETKDSFITDDYTMFDMAHTILPTKLPLKQFYKEYAGLFTSATPFVKKIKKIRQLEPHMRKKIITNTRVLIDYIKNAYQEYDQRYW